MQDSYFLAHIAASRLHRQCEPQLMALMWPPDVSDVCMTHRSQASKGKWENKEDLRVEMLLPVLFPEGVIRN